MRAFVFSAVVACFALLGAEASNINNGGGSTGGGGAGVSAISAHFTNTITTPDHAFHTIVWDTQDSITGTGLSFNTGTGVLTVNTTGFLSINATVLFNTTNYSQGTLFISGSGSHEQGAVNNAGNSFGGSNYAYTGCTSSFYVTAGDTFTVSYGQQGSGATAILGGAGNNTMLAQLIAQGTGGGGGGGPIAGAWGDLWLTGNQSIATSSATPIDWTGSSFTGSGLALATDGGGHKYVSVTSTGMLSMSVYALGTASLTQEQAILEVIQKTGLNQKAYPLVQNGSFGSGSGAQEWSVTSTFHVTSGDLIYAYITLPTGGVDALASGGRYTGTTATVTLVPTSN